MSNATSIRKGLLAGSIAVVTGAAPLLSEAQEAAKSSAVGTVKPGDQVAPQQTETELRNAVQANPNDPDARLRLARFYIQLRRLPSAEAEARAARKIGDQTDEADALLARIMYGERKGEQLLSLLHPADREPGPEAEVRLYLGLSHLQLGESKAADPLLHDAVRLDPKSVTAHLALVSFLLSDGQLADAGVQLDIVRTIAPTSTAIPRYTGELDLAKGDGDAAIVQFDKVLETDPKDVATLYDRALALITENKLADAQRDVDAVTQVSRLSPRVIFLSGLILARQGKMAAADAKLTAVENAFGRGPDGYYLQGSVKFWLGQYGKADAALAKAQGRQPNELGIRRLRAKIAIQIKAPYDAVSLLEPMLQDNPADQETATVLGRAYVANGHPDRALELYEGITGLRPTLAVQPVAAKPAPGAGEYSVVMAEIDKINTTQPDPDMSAALGELRRAKALADKKHIDEAKAVLHGLVQRSP